MTCQPVFILGASDPEMQCVEDILCAQGVPYTHALYNGKRVSPREAYKAELPEGVQGRPVVLVECGIPSLDEGLVVARCDHHNPGDYGAGMPPERYWEASSLGQVFRFLESIGRAPEKVHWAWKYIAAADHCPAAAYAGKCPGIDVPTLRHMRTEQRARYLMALPPKAPERKAVDDYRQTHGLGDDLQGWMLALRRLVMDAVTELYAAPGVELGGIWVADLRDLGTVPELPTATMECGLAALYKVGRKVGIIGAGEGTDSGTAPIEAFLGGWAEEQGLVEVYGDPVRGYAGGYLPADNQ